MSLVYAVGCLIIFVFVYVTFQFKKLFERDMKNKAHILALMGKVTSLSSTVKKLLEDIDDIKKENTAN